MPDSLVEAADELTAGLDSTAASFIHSMDVKVNDEDALFLMNVIDEHLPFYLNAEDYAAIDSLLTEEGVRNKLEQNLKSIMLPTGIAIKKYLFADPLGIHFIALKKLQQLQINVQFEIYADHFISPDKKNLVFFINPSAPSSETAINGKLVDALDHQIAAFNAHHSGDFEINYFGAPAVAVANARQVREDSVKTVSVTVIMLLLIIGIVFKRPVNTFLMLLPVAAGALFALTLIYFIKGSISLIAIGTGSVILGIAVNYSLHLMIHYLYHPDIRKVIRDLTFPLVIGSATTIGGFLCLQLVDSEVMNDFGLFAALSLIGAALFTLIFLPHLLKQPPAVHVTNEQKRVSKNYRVGRWMMPLILLITIVLFFFARNVGFDSDMNALNYMPDHLKKSESRINSVSGFGYKTVMLASSGKNLDEALAAQERVVPVLDSLKRIQQIYSYSGISGILLSTAQQQEKIKLWRSFWTASRVEKTFALLKEEGKKLHFKAEAFDRFRNTILRNYESYSTDEISVLQKGFLSSLISENKEKSTILSIIKTKNADTDPVYKAFIGKQNTLVFDREVLTRVLVDTVFTDFTFIAMFTSILVFSVLLITYGRIELALISFIPMIISWIWILGLMALTGVKFNIVNSILSTFIFALGDDYSIFMMDGLLQKFARARTNLPSIRKSIQLSAITTVTGLGILILAKHPALKSIAAISVIGILCVLLISQTVIPFLFNMLIQRRTDRKMQPWTFSSLLKSVFAFLYFLLGAVLLTLSGPIVLYMLPFPKAKRKYFYHFILSKFAGSLVYIMANVKKKIINTSAETFDKPAVIIANHQSFVDILVMVMLHPRIIMLTNEWVWNSPVMGAVVRMAQYYPVASGIEGSVEKLRILAAEGYSIVIFPEGTRYNDGRIHRFHKGAFLLAKELKMDLVPVLLHGIGDSMPKGDFMLRDARITVKILQRISSDDLSAQSYQEATKHVQQLMRDEFEQLKKLAEIPDYFFNRLKSNYLYKGPVIEWYMRIKVRLENNYLLFLKNLPEKGKVLDIGCGYGFLCYMLNYRSPDLKITGIDYDEEKIEIAQNNWSHTENLSFHYADAMNFELQEYDAIILSDVLHYLQQTQQELLIDNCIRHLNPGGVLLIRDGMRDFQKEHKATRLTELFSTRLLSFNKTTAELIFPTIEQITNKATEWKLQLDMIDGGRYTSNTTFALRKRM